MLLSMSAAYITPDNLYRVSMKVNPSRWSNFPSQDHLPRDHSAGDKDGVPQKYLVPDPCNSQKNQILLTDLLLQKAGAKNCSGAGVNTLGKKEGALAPSSPAQHLPTSSDL